MGKEKVRIYGVKAYFTVEAAMVLAVVMSVIVIVIYIMLFQYNRCVMEQDVGILGLQSCAMQTESREVLLREMHKKEQELYADKYIAWETDNVIWKMGKMEIQVEQTGLLKLPFKKNQWKGEAVYKNKDISPVLFLRLCNKGRGGR